MISLEEFKERLAFHAYMRRQHKLDEEPMKASPIFDKNKSEKASKHRKGHGIVFW